MSEPGFVYLLHFEQPISPRHTTQHYLGYAEDLAARLQAHALGHGARLTQVARERGIHFQVARVWRGTRLFERRLKRRKEAPRLCPFCGGRFPTVASDRELSAEEIDEALIGF